MSKGKPQKLIDYSPYLFIKKSDLEKRRDIKKNKIKLLMNDASKANDRINLRNEIRIFDNTLDIIKNYLDSINVTY